MINPRPSQIEPEERLTNYIFEKRFFSHQRVKVQAFRPRRPSSGPPEFQLSVYRTEECEESEIWDLGDTYVRDQRQDHKPPIIARGDIKAREAFDQQLQVVSSPQPHFLHADIVDWPEGEEHRLMKAVELANKAVLCIRPPAN